jgi:NAD(P)-dependent dehydrogenase (short-subunit alcohol dehydrogenase family)
MPQLIWLVTGCSAGIGEAFVYEILSRGDKVIASSRGTSSRLAHLQEAGAKIPAMDINAPQVELDQKIEEAIGFYGGIDVLVNNAGFFDWNVIETRYIQLLSNPLK